MYPSFNRFRKCYIIDMQKYLETNFLLAKESLAVFPLSWQSVFQITVEVIKEKMETSDYKNAPKSELG